MERVHEAESACLESTFHALADNGRIEMLLQETFWARRFGAVVDQFGTPWTINSETGAEH